MQLHLPAQFTNEVLRLADNRKLPEYPNFEGTYPNTEETEQETGSIHQAIIKQEQKVTPLILIGKQEGNLVFVTYTP